MLTRELGIYDIKGNEIYPERLRQKPHEHYVGYATEMLRIFREGIGRTRQELRSAVTKLFENEPECPPRRIEAFCKLLEEDGISRFDTDHGAKAAKLRTRVFRSAAPDHPLVESRDALFEHSEIETKARIARELGFEDWGAIDKALFADVFENNRLLEFMGYESPMALLSRYNVAQIQVALFGATRLTVWARSDFRQIVTHAKLAHLLHDIMPPPESQPCGEYVIVLDGPASVLRETRRYGVNMARFLPALISCREWRMEAEIPSMRHRRALKLKLSAKDGLKAAMPPPKEYDSSVEEGFANKWGTERRDGWLMRREADILQKRQTVFIPDFSFTHEDGRRALLEIIGFWTPEYLKAKLDKLRLFGNEPIILVVAEGVAERWDGMPSNVILYKTAVKLSDVLKALGRISPLR